MDHHQFEKSIILRNLRHDDYEAVVEMELLCFPGMEPSYKDQFESMIDIFPEGQFAVEVDGELAATASSLIVHYADYGDWHDWYSVSDSGYIRNHDPDGDTLYGIEIQVHPRFQGKKLSRRLYEARKQLCKEHNLARVIIGGRIPGFMAHQGKLSAREYIDAVIDRKLYDQVLTTQLSNGFVLRQLVGDYYPTDMDSAGFATILEWPNLDHLRDSGTRRVGRAVQNVRVASVQYKMRGLGSWDEFVDRVTFFVAAASDNRSDFILFPELFTLQLLSMHDGIAEGKSARELSRRYHGPFLELMTELATGFNINIIGGTIFGVDDRDRLLNSAYLFRRDGTIARQDKIHITPNEVECWGVIGGDQARGISTDCGVIGICICYDVQFPELARKLAAEGAGILFVPYNCWDKKAHLRVSVCAQARCVENHVYVVTAGCVGTMSNVENTDINYARSGIYTPIDIGFARDGIAAIVDAPNEETLLYEDLDLELLRRHRLYGSVRNWRDRRQDLYEVAWHD